MRWSKSLFIYNNGILNKNNVGGSLEMLCLAKKLYYQFPLDFHAHRFPNYFDFKKLQSKGEILLQNYVGHKGIWRTIKSHMVYEGASNFVNRNIQKTFLPHPMLLPHLNFFFCCFSPNSSQRTTKRFFKFCIERLQIHFAYLL